ncbi:hypothetical protein [Streptomyces sp. S.PB5]|uniref:hypothetical protein n=1 Tax=Streptomyces sp. S.PB5 TaxID=3020844 RepID=UPI0025AFC95A|nr:hypothetical protein [Streptomyces sp. S.PB5]MDN3027903.1 hypothetical protein [Streptomyces sp. S.PB5]
MSRRSLKTLLAAGSAAAVMALLPTSAHADSSSGGNYGLYGNEGQYPTTNYCTGTFRQVGATKYADNMALKYFYSDKCGSYARIENSRQNCAAVLERSDNGVGRADGWVSESVDPGITYAYTQMGNNLNGRVSRALLVCDGHQKAETAWF